MLARQLRQEVAIVESKGVHIIIAGAGQVAYIVGKIQCLYHVAAAARGQSLAGGRGAERRQIVTAGKGRFLSIIAQKIDNLVQIHP